MAILVLQHSPAGVPGRLGRTLRDHGLVLDIRRGDLPAEDSANRGVEPIPTDLDEVDGLVILGGPPNVTDIASLPWMQREAELIRRAHAAELPMVGICLGAQLIAHALGGEVRARSAPLAGFSKVSLNAAGQTETITAGLPWDFDQLFLCGQEVSKLPAGAQLLCGGKDVPHAAFRAGLRTYGFLFHFECDEALARNFLKEEGVADPGSAVAASYAAYARVSDRLCANLAAFLFSPLLAPTGRA